MPIFSLPCVLYDSTASFPILINLLNPTGYVMHQQFNISSSIFCPHCIYVFCIYLRTNNDFYPPQHKLIGFYNRDEVFTARYGLGI